MLQFWGGVGFPSLDSYVGAHGRRKRLYPSSQPLPPLRIRRRLRGGVTQGPFLKGALSPLKNPAQMPKLIELNVEYTQDAETAIQYQQKYWAGTYVPALFDQKIYTPQMSTENGQVVEPDTIKKSACISANAEDHVKFAMQYIELGFNHLFFHAAHADQRAFLEGYGRDVLPQIRRRSER